MAVTLINGMTPSPLTPVWVAPCGDFGTLEEEGWEGGTLDTSRYHKSLNEKLGVATSPGACLSHGSTQINSIQFRVALREYVFGFATYQTGLAFNPYLSLLNSSGTVQHRFQVYGADQDLSVRRGTTELFRAGPGSVPVRTDFQYIIAHCRSHPTDGFMRAYLGTIQDSNKLGEFTGNTQVTSSDPKMVTVQSNGANSRTYWDDIVAYGRTLFVTKLAAVPAEGESITDVSSGATATVDAVEVDDDDPFQAIIYLAGVSGDFGAGHVVSFSGGAIARAENDHPEDLEGLAKPVFMRVLRPDSDLTSPAEWTPASGASNWEAINDPGHSDNANYISSTVAGQVTKHSLTDGNHILYTGAAFVVPVAVAAQSGGLPGLKLTVESGSGVSSRSDLVDSNVAMKFGAFVTKNPDDGSDFDPASIDALQLELESES